MKVLASNLLLFTVALGVCLGQGRAIPAVGGVIRPDLLAGLEGAV